MALILVVEDDFIIRESIEMILEMEGYTVQAARNGKEALDLLVGSPSLPCLILLDLMMPVMDGIEFRERQRKDPNIAHVPVVVITGRADAADMATALSAKVIPKPFTPHAILGAVGEHCAPI